MKNITLIIPAKEESESLPIVLDELKKFDFTIKVILKEDDVETINSIKDLDCEIIFQNGTGYGNALINGINNTNTDYRLQYPLRHRHFQPNCQYFVSMNHTNFLKDV